MEHQKRSHRRRTDVIEIPTEDEMRRAFGVQQLVRLMKGNLPVKGKSIHILSGGNVDLIAHLRWLLEGYKRFKKVFISAWAISGVDILLLKRWKEHGDIEEIELLVGDVYPSNYKKEYEKLKEMVAVGLLKKVMSNTIHSKLMLLQPFDGECVVIESSANCNMNPRVEQSVVTVSTELYDFYYDNIKMLEDEKAIVWH